MTKIPAIILIVLFLSLLPLASSALEADAAIEESATVETTEANARRWSLSIDEWRRYQEIMKGEGRYNWQTADPITVLGIYAETNAERDRYAERVAIQEYTLTKRFLDFNSAYLLAGRRLYGDQPAMDLNKFYAFYNTTAPGAPPLRGDNNQSLLGAMGDRFVLFISPDCTGCNDAYLALRDAQKVGTTLDIYFVGASDNDITHWAKTMAINPDLVKNRTVTLNGEGDMYARYNRPPLPAAFYYKQSSNSVHPVNLGDGGMQ